MLQRRRAGRWRRTKINTAGKQRRRGGITGRRLMCGLGGNRPAAADTAPRGGGPRQLRRTGRPTASSARHKAGRAEWAGAAPRSRSAPPSTMFHSCHRGTSARRGRGRGRRPTERNRPRPRRLLSQARSSLDRRDSRAGGGARPAPIGSGRPARPGAAPLVLPPALLSRATRQEGALPSSPCSVVLLPLPGCTSALTPRGWRGSGGSHPLTGSHPLSPVTGPAGPEPGSAELGVCGSRSSAAAAAAAGRLRSRAPGGPERGRLPGESPPHTHRGGRETDGPPDDRWAAGARGSHPGKRDASEKRRRYRPAPAAAAATAAAAAAARWRK